ncbi:hypothetical protein DFH06DRAFT_1131526 [Mycena polygramma]|nr:hypothetical protein DFH06DRAFT_1131526 [Mycena polygramma]
MTVYQTILAILRTNSQTLEFGKRSQHGRYELSDSNTRHITHTEGLSNCRYAAVDIATGSFFRGRSDLSPEERFNRIERQRLTLAGAYSDVNHTSSLERLRRQTSGREAGAEIDRWKEDWLHLSAGAPVVSTLELVKKSSRERRKRDLVRCRLAVPGSREDAAGFEMRWNASLCQPSGSEIPEIGDPPFALPFRTPLNPKLGDKTLEFLVLLKSFRGKHVGHGLRQDRRSENDQESTTSTAEVSPKKHVGNAEEQFSRTMAF